MVAPEPLPRYREIGPSRTITHCVIAPDERTLFGVANDESIRVWRLDRPEAPPSVLADLGRHPGWVDQLLVLPETGLLVAATEYGEIRAWSLDAPGTPLLFTLKAPRVRNSAGFVDFHERLTMITGRGTTLAAASSRGPMYLWDLEHPDQPPRRLEGHHREIFLGTVSPEERTLVQLESSEDTQVR